jgi:hypothetical protein
MDDYSLTSSPPFPTFAYCSLGVNCKFAVPYNKKNRVFNVKCLTVSEFYLAKAVMSQLTAEQVLVVTV